MLEQRHPVLQKAMGWTDSHLREFIVGGRRYGIPAPDEPEYQVAVKALKGTFSSRPGYYRGAMKSKIVPSAISNLGRAVRSW